MILRSKPFVTFLGDVENPPTITGNRTAGELGKDGKQLKTYKSATVAINSDYFLAVNMKFEVSPFLFLLLFYHGCGPAQIWIISSMLKVHYG